MQTPDSAPNTSLDKQPRIQWKPIIQRWLPLIITFLMALALYVYLRDSQMLEQIDFQHVRWEFLVLLILSRLAVYMLLGLVLLAYCSHMAARLDFTEWFGLSVAGGLINLLTPIAGGAVVRAAYLKRRYDLPTAHYITFVGVCALINFFVAGAAGLVSLAILASTGTVPYFSTAILIMVALIIGPIVVLCLPLERLPIPGTRRVARSILTVLLGWRDLREETSLLFWLVVLTLALIVMQGLSTYLGLLALDQPTPFFKTLFVGAAISAWRVTPTVGFGIQEAIAAAGAGLVGISPVQTFVAAVLVRLANWICMFTFGSLYTYLLSRRLGMPLAQASEAAYARESSDDGPDAANMQKDAVDA